MIEFISQAENPFKNVPEQCDPYSGFGLFCNVGSLWEGFFVIVAVAGLVGLSIWFVKNNEKQNQERRNNS